MRISEQDKKAILKAIDLPNTEYGKTLMFMAEKYEIFSKEDIVSLTDRQESKRAFLSDYAMLRLISNPNEIKKEVKDKAGYNRYYPIGYKFYGNIYEFTSQFYCYQGEDNHKDNRTPY